MTLKFQWLFLGSEQAVILITQPTQNGAMMVLISNNLINPRTVGRLSIYRRVLIQLANEGIMRVFSRDLAKMAGVSPSQVRQDLMKVSTNGTPQNGYSVAELTQAVITCLGTTKITPVVLLGAGPLGQAILDCFKATQPNLVMSAVFEVNPNMVGKHLYDIPVLDFSMLANHVQAGRIQTAILALPAEEAQQAVDILIASGVSSILNFTTARLQVPSRVFVENNDILLSLERVAFYATDTAEEKVRA